MNCSHSLCDHIRHTKCQCQCCHEGFSTGKSLDIPHLSGDQTVDIQIKTGIPLSGKVFHTSAF